MAKIKLECCHADTCLPDYWSGHHLPHIQIPVYNGMSLAGIKGEILSELKNGYVMGNSENAFLLSSDYVGPDKAKAAEGIFKAAIAAVNRMKPEKKGTRKFFTDIEEQPEDSDFVYAFFVFVEID